MTHFTVGIIVPEDKLPHARDYIAGLLAPFDEDRKVPPYVCYSLQEAAGDIEREIRRFRQILERQDPDYDLARCRQRLDELGRTTPEARYREYLGGHERFNERGEPISTANPAARWDWYVIGGRWDGWLNDRKSKSGSLADNMATTGEAIVRGKIPHALVTPDGRWHERGQMGWFAVLLSENEGWDAEARSILAGHPGCRLVIVDAHI